MPKLEQPGGSNPSGSNPGNVSGGFYRPNNRIDEVTNAPGGAGSEAAERARHQQQIERGTPAPLPKGGKL
jgi:hypothetical protein